jgi:Mn2+/Fe2+ NRAMP family transporter
VGLVHAPLLSAAILPLATAYNVCEGLGFEAGIDKRFSEAPIFYWLYTLLIGGSAAIVLIPHLPLLKFLIYSQVANGVLLPFVLVYMLLLVNRPRIMGSFKNKPWQNWIAWGTAVIMIGLTVVLVYTSVAGA